MQIASRAPVSSTASAVLRPPPAEAVASYAGYLGKVAGADAKPNRNYISKGSYSGIIERCTEGVTRSGKPYFVADFRITEASADSTVPVGDVVSWFINLAFEGSERDVRGLLNATCTPAELASLDSDTEEVAMSFLGTVTGNSQVLQGRSLRIQATNVLTKAGKEFTKVACFSEKQALLPGVAHSE